MPKFSKKPVEIEAIQLQVGLPDVPDWLNFADNVSLFMDGTALIDTLEGTMHAACDDWIIKGVKGEIYPCKPDIFALTYDPVSAPQEAETP